MDSSNEIVIDIQTKNPIQETTPISEENLPVCETGDKKCFSRLLQAIGDCI